MSDHGRYNARIDAMNFSMEHDDGQSVRDLSPRRRYPDRPVTLRKDADHACIWRSSTPCSRPTSR